MGKQIARFLIGTEIDTKSIKNCNKYLEQFVKEASEEKNIRIQISQKAFKDVNSELNKLVKNIDGKLQNINFSNVVSEWVREIGALDSLDDQVVAFKEIIAGIQNFNNLSNIDKLEFTDTDDLRLYIEYLGQYEDVLGRIPNLMQRSFGKNRDFLEKFDDTKITESTDNLVKYLVAYENLRIAKERGAGLDESDYADFDRITEKVNAAVDGSEYFKQVWADIRTMISNQPLVGEFKAIDLSSIEAGVREEAQKAVDEAKKAIQEQNIAVETKLNFKFPKTMKGDVKKKIEALDLEGPVKIYPELSSNFAERVTELTKDLAETPKVYLTGELREGAEEAIQQALNKKEFSAKIGTADASEAKMTTSEDDNSFTGVKNQIDKIKQALKEKNDALAASDAVALGVALDEYNAFKDVTDQVQQLASQIGAVKTVLSGLNVTLPNLSGLKLPKNFNPEDYKVLQTVFGNLKLTLADFNTDAFSQFVTTINSMNLAEGQADRLTQFGGAIENVKRNLDQLTANGSKATAKFIDSLSNLLSRTKELEDLSNILKSSGGNLGKIVDQLNANDSKAANDAVANSYEKLIRAYKDYIDQRKLLATEDVGSPIYKNIQDDIARSRRAIATWTSSLKRNLKASGVDMSKFIGKQSTLDGLITEANISNKKTNQREVEDQITKLIKNISDAYQKLIELKRQAMSGNMSGNAVDGLDAQIDELNASIIEAEGNLEELLGNKYVGKDFGKQVDQLKELKALSNSDDIYSDIYEAAEAEKAAQALEEQRRQEEAIAQAQAEANAKAEGYYRKQIADLKEIVDLKEKQAKLDSSVGQYSSYQDEIKKIQSKINGRSKYLADAIADENYTGVSSNIIKDYNKLNAKNKSFIEKANQQAASDKANQDLLETINKLIAAYNELINRKTALAKAQMDGQANTNAETKAIQEQEREVVKLEKELAVRDSNKNVTEPYKKERNQLMSAEASSSDQSSIDRSAAIELVITKYKELATEMKALIKDKEALLAAITAGDQAEADSTRKSVENRIENIKRLEYAIDDLKNDYDIKDSSIRADTKDDTASIKASRKESSNLDKQINHESAQKAVEALKEVQAGTEVVVKRSEDCRQAIVALFGSASQEAQEYIDKLGDVRSITGKVSKNQKTGEDEVSYELKGTNGNLILGKDGDVLKYNEQVIDLSESYNQVTRSVKLLEAEEAKANSGRKTQSAAQKAALEEMKSIYQEIQNLEGYDPNTKKLTGTDNIEATSQRYEKLATRLDQLSTSYRSLSAGVSQTQIQKALSKVYNWMDRNTKGAQAFEAELQQLITELKQVDNVADLNKTMGKVMAIENAVSATDNNGGTFWEQFSREANYNLSSMIAQYLSFQDVVRYSQQAVSTINDLDYALLDLKKTTKMTNSDLEEFYYTSSDLAGQLGVTTEEVIDLASSWSRLGSGPIKIRLSPYEW